jgi:hypothetical protein
MGKKSGSGMNNQDHISESVETIFGLKYLNSLMWILDGKKFGSGINIPDPQHYFHSTYSACCLGKVSIE